MNQPYHWLCDACIYRWSTEHEIKDERGWRRCPMPLCESDEIRPMLEPAPPENEKHE